MKQLIAGGGVALVGTTLVPLLSSLLSLPDQTKKYGIRDTALLCLLYD